MSWFKKIVSRILGDEIEEPSAKNNMNNNDNNEDQYKSFEQFENDYEYEEIKYEDEYIQQQQRKQARSVEPNFIKKRESFKFPLIPDENEQYGDETGFTKSSSKQQAQQENMTFPDWVSPNKSVRPVRKEASNQVQHERSYQAAQHMDQRPEMYSPFAREPRGLKGVVEKTSRENYNPFNPNGTKSLNPSKKYTPQQNRVEKKAVSEPVKPSYVPKKKKFVPTEVPSPIYGFQKPPKRGRSIYDLLDEKQKEKEQSSGKVDFRNEIAATTVKASSNQKNTESISSAMVDETYGNEATTVNENAVELKNSEKHLYEKDQNKVTKTEEQEGQVQNVVNEHIVVEKEQNRAQLQNTSPLKEESIEETGPLLNKEETNMDEKVEIEETILKSDETTIETEPMRPFKEAVDIEETNHSDDSSETIRSIAETDPKVSETMKVETIEIEKALDPEEVTREEPEVSINGGIPDKEIKTTEVFTQLEDEEISKEEIAQSQPVKVENFENRKSGSQIPFNVVMLKSDKKKIEQSIAQTTPLSRAKTWSEPDSKSVRSESESPKDVMPKEEYKELAEQDTKKVEEVNGESSATAVRMSVPLKQEEQEKTASIQDTSEHQRNMIVEQEPSTVNDYLETALSYLEPPEEQTEDFEWMDTQGVKLIEALSYFQIEGEIVQIVQGPAVTQFEITVGHGVKVSKIRNLADDLKLALAAKDIRIQAPIPGKSSIGIEIPNRKSRPVRLSEVVTHESFVDSKSPLEAALGLDLTGEPVTIDLRKMPHGMIAGATGSGKSVCINSLLISLLLKASPQDVKLMLIDPKMVELAPFNHIPHLVSPVITDVKAATAALKWAVDEMDRRYQLFAHVGARDITRYNKMVEKERKYSLKMPYLVIVIDELADLMMMSPQEVEESICRIAQKARACGIHLVLATQRPSVDVITGLIKSNIPTRIAFSVSSHVDSRTILDCQGAERLLGRGDMLYLGNGMSAPVRVQGTYVTDEEIEAVTNFVRTLGEPDYLFEQDELLKKVDSIDEQDELFEEACRYICSEGSVSASSLQRKYRIGYNRAARLVDMMEAQGFISESKGTKPRDVFLTEHDIEEIFGTHDA